MEVLLATLPSALLILAAPSASAPAGPSPASVAPAPVRPESDGVTTADEDAPALDRYLRRDVQHSARHLDHGVLGVAAAGGYPHAYRLALSLGVLDHLTVGATAHWLPDQAVPQWSPQIAVAFIRLRRFEAGAHYTQVLYTPPERDTDPRTPSFQERDHWLLTTMSFSNYWLSGGFDFGVVRGIEKDPSRDPPDVFTNPKITRWRLGGGLHLRAGTRRWGVTLNTLAPRLMAEAVLDVRFGLFEKRRRGGWRPRDVVYSTDRRVPTWR